jgi:hypothetical protein
VSINEDGGSRLKPSCRSPWAAGFGTEGIVNIVIYFAASARSCVQRHECPSNNIEYLPTLHTLTKQKGRMIYKFKSPTADLIRLEKNCRCLQEIIGKTPSTLGNVRMVEMPDATVKFEQAIPQMAIKHRATAVIWSGTYRPQHGSMLRLIY